MTRKIIFRDPVKTHDDILISGRSVRQFADDIGITYQAVYQALNGKIGVAPKTAKTIAEDFGKPFEELFVIRDGKETKS